jgi:hypothetical protein
MDAFIVSLVEVGLPPIILGTTFGLARLAMFWWIRRDVERCQRIRRGQPPPG